MVHGIQQTLFRTDQFRALNSKIDFDVYITQNFKFSYFSQHKTFGASQFKSYLISKWDKNIDVSQYISFLVYPIESNYKKIIVQSPRSQLSY